MSEPRVRAPLRWLRYASRSANALVKVESSIEAAKAGAEAHADRYDTRV